MNKSNKFFTVLLVFLMATATAEPVIIQKPIVFNQERINLTREYRQQHYGISQKSIEIIPQMIVLHWTERPTFKEAFDLFYPARLNNRTDLEKAGNLNTSAHFLVDRDGTIYQLMPTNWMARHVIGLNNIAIGIENVGGSNGKQDLTQQQIAADVALVRKLVTQYPSIHYLIGHFEYGRFKGSKLWEEKDSTYFTNKQDPGPLFMREVRQQVTNFHLQDHPIND